MTTSISNRTKKPRVQKPPAEVVGSFAHVLKREACDDGRDLYEFWEADADSSLRIYILAKSELDAWKALRSELGTLEKMTKAKLAERTTQEVLKLMEAQNGETQKDGEEKDDAET